MALPLLTAAEDCVFSWERPVGERQHATQGTQVRLRARPRALKPQSLRAAGKRASGKGKRQP